MLKPSILFPTTDLSLTNTGISGPLLNWFKDYLAGRKQRGILDGFASDFAPVMSGVPQGSILGPLVFTIFILQSTNIDATTGKSYSKLNGSTYRREVK